MAGKLDLMIRPVIILLFTLAVIYGFAVTKDISSDAFLTIAAAVIMWLFGGAQRRTPTPTNGTGNGTTGTAPAEPAKTGG